MRLTFKKKIICLAASSAVLPVLVMFIMIGQLERDVVQRATTGLETLARTNVAQITSDVYGLCSMTDDLFTELVMQNTKAAREILYANGPVTLGSNVTWKLLDDNGEQFSEVTLPALQVGNLEFSPDYSVSSFSPVVDDILRITGMACTLFQRINDEGDMLRIASTLSNTKDKSLRAVGTYYKALNPDGTRSEIIDTVIQGEMHSGVDTVLGNTYLVSRFAVTNIQGEIVGMLGIGRKIESMNFLKRIISSTHVGERGYVWVFNAAGEDKGTAIITEHGSQNGEQMWDAQDEAGKFYVREMIENAVEKPGGTIQFERYVIKNPVDEKHLRRIIAYTYFPAWNWVIGASAYEEEYYALNDRIKDETRESLQFLLIGGIGLLVLVALLAGVTGNHIARPLEQINQVASRIAEGNIREALKMMKTKARNRDRRIAKDEIDQLNGSFEKMTDSLAALLGQVRRSGIQVTTSATEIAAASRQLEATAVEQAASTRAVSKTTADITETTQDLVQTMDGVGVTADETAGMAESGRTKLHEMQEVMQQLVKSTESISSKLAVINEKTGRISSVVTTINSISDHTNLLSLNAAIEAEKAGEHGRGFSVVAREITRLADQTATATQDIEYMVKEMQSSVSSGVMEMDKFGEGVREGVREVADIADQLGGIIDQVRALGPQFDDVQNGMTNQLDGARQISETVAELASSADQTRDSLHEFQHVTEQLNTAVKGLQQEVTRFEIGDS